MGQERKTLCNRDCPDACGLVATVEDGRVTRIRGDPNHPITRGFLCYRTSLFLETQYASDRLTTPLLRKGGVLTPVGWEEALDVAAEALLRIRRQSGPQAIFHYRSGGSLGLLKLLTDYFFQRFGPVTVKRGDICSGAGDAAQLTDFGVEDSNDLHDLLNARHILLWGKNVFVSSPHTLPVLREARARSTPLTLIDPVHHRTASLCDRYVQPRPGGDFALAMAVAQVLFERAWVDPRAGDYCDHLDEFRALAFSRAREIWCQEAEVAPSVPEELAWQLGPGKPCAILVGWGMGRRSNGAASIRALDALGAISGNLGISGGGVSYYFARRRAFATERLSDPAPAPRTISEALMAEALEQANPPIRAIWVTAGNPVAMLPDSARLARAFSACEFTVVVDSFLTDTARQATLVLPTTSLLEADDLLGAYGHHYVGVAEPVVPPPPGVLSDLEIIQALARRVGLAEAVAGSARDWKRRLANPRLEPAGLSLDALEQRPHRNPLAPRILFSDRKFATPSGRVNLITQAPPATGQGPRDDPAFPLTLMALSSERSQSSQWARPQEDLAEVTVHPESAITLGEGDEAWLESRLGRLRVRLRLDARQRRDVALMPKGGHFQAGRCANALIRGRLTDLGEGGALYEERVRLLPIEAAPQPP